MNNLHPAVLILKGTGEAVTLLEPNNILEYIDRYMGYDAKKYIENMIAENRELEEMLTEFEKEER
jgi:hypothetical protein